MKKMLSLLLAVVMCLSVCSLSFAEEEILIEELTVELDETYQEVALSEDYAVTYIPADWVTLEAEYADETSELLGSFVNADGTTMLLVTYAETETPSSYEEVYAQSVEAGLSAGIVIINEIEYVCITSMVEDSIVMIANTFLDEECTASIAFTFTFPAADVEAMELVCNQVLGGLAFVE